MPLICLNQFYPSFELIKWKKANRVQPPAALSQESPVVGNGPSLHYAYNIPLSCCCDLYILYISAKSRDGCLQAKLVGYFLSLRCKSRAEVLIYA